MNTVVRPMEPDDTGAAAEVWWRARVAARAVMPAPVHSEEQVRRWFADVLLADGQTWVAEQDGRVVAVLTLDGDDLDQLYVVPELAGQGIGSMLVDLAKQLRPDGLELWVFQTNLAAQEFYRRHGFAEVRRTDGSHNEERAPDVRMAWRPELS
jgi:ribosomal protein S18 acetylase RimI-like enzyme